MNDFNHLGTAIEKENMFGGSGKFRAWPFRNVRRYMPFGAAVLCEIAPAGSVGEVAVDDCSETICVLSGQAEVRVNGELHSVEAGQSVDVPRHARLSVANASRKAALQYLLQKVD